MVWYPGTPWHSQAATAPAATGLPEEIGVEPREGQLSAHEAGSVSDAAAFG